MYKILILGTLLLGVMALAANVITSTRRSQHSAATSRHAHAGPMFAAVRAPMAAVAARLGVSAAAAAEGADSATGAAASSSKKKKKAGKDVDDEGKNGKVRKTDDEWKAELSAEQYNVTRCSATERPFTGKYWNHHEKGTYVCVACGQELFKSDTKFDSGSGWPSYFQPVSKSAISELKDISYGMVRTEVVCSRCESHLGHVFRDGPRPTGLRYCINSAALDFEPRAGKAEQADDDAQAQAQADDAR